MARTYRSTDVKDMCENKLGVIFRASKHLVGWVTDEEVKLARVTVPLGRDELTPGTLRAIIRDLGADKDTFAGLMDCPTTREDLLDRLRRG